MSQVYLNTNLVNIDGEEWKDIKEYEGLYQVSNMGRIKSLKRTYKTGRNLARIKTDDEKIIKPFLNGIGYLQVSLSKDGCKKQFRVHKLVAEAFISNPENKPYIDHINTDKLDNTVNNLRWATPKENSNNPLTKERIKNINHDSCKKKVLCVTTGKIFNSVKEAKDFYNIKDKRKLTGEYPVGKLPDGTKLYWEYK